MSTIVAIVGRPNVGKSTLFNRLIGKRKAIVDDISGVTRDRQYDYSDWNGKEFMLIDTGGYVENSDDIFEIEIKKQVELAINEAQIILFVVDVTVGITDQDQTFARYLRKVSKPVVVIANKSDNSSKLNDQYEFYRLGFNNIFPLSAINGSGTGELLDHIAELMPEGEPKEEIDIPKISIVGRPNVGKSTFVNALLGEERNIVSNIPGTTRDSIHSYYNKYGKEFILIDTAGLRKKNKVSENIEFYSVLRAVMAVEESDICILIIDANEGIQAQDLNIVRLAQKRNKGLLILLNKWDSVSKNTNSVAKEIEKVKERTAPFTDLPVLTISALNKVRIFKALDIAIEVFNNRSKKIPTAKLNKILLEAIEKYQPPTVKGKHVSIKYITQLKASHPVFAFFCNHPQYVKESYKRYLENQLRQNFDLTGCPVKIYFRKK
jgi:GTP-binding protein